MQERIRTILKECLPPVFIRIGLNTINTLYGFHGDFTSWQAAQDASSGYDAENIITKVRDALLKVKRGEAAYERDSVLFDEIQYSWPLLAGLLRIASTNNNRLSVLDFGGSLGSSYYQSKSFLSILTELHWSIVEQKSFVQCGKKYFEDEHLRFYYDLQSCIKNEQIDIVLLSSVLPYLEKPYDVLEEIMSFGIRHIIIDRTPLLLSGDRHRLTVQKVRPSIYNSSYPAWFFNKKKFLDFIQKRYQIIAVFDCDVRPNIKSEFKGFILEKH